MAFVWKNQQHRLHFTRPLPKEQVRAQYHLLVRIDQSIPGLGTYPVKGMQ